MAVPSKKQKQGIKKKHQKTDVALAAVKKIDRDALKGLTIDEVNKIMASKKLSQKDVDIITGQVKYLHESLERFEVKTKAQTYLLMIKIYEDKNRLLEPVYAQFFAKYLMDYCGVKRRDAYRKLKTIKFVLEYDLHRFLEDTSLVLNVIDKLQYMAECDSGQRKQLVNRLQENQQIELREIRAVKDRKSRVRWEKSALLSGFRTRITKGKFEIEGKDQELLNKQYAVSKSMTRAEIEDRYTEL